MKQLTKLDQNQVLRHSYNEDTKSLDVTLQNLELSIELDANDGDSVQVVKKSQVFKSEGPVTEFEIDIEMLDKVAVYCTKPFSLMISPDGENYFQEASVKILEVLAKKLKVVSAEAQDVIIVGK